MIQETVLDQTLAFRSIGSFCHLRQNIQVVFKFAAKHKGIFVKCQEKNILRCMLCCRFNIGMNAAIIPKQGQSQLLDENHFISCSWKD